MPPFRGHDKIGLVVRITSRNAIEPAPPEGAWIGWTPTGSIRWPGSWKLGLPPMTDLHPWCRDTVTKALWVVGKTLEKPSAEAAVMAVGWVFLSASPGVTETRTTLLKAVEFPEPREGASALKPEEEETALP